MIARHFARINVAELALKARADKAAMGGETAKLRVRGLRMELQTSRRVAAASRRRGTADPCRPATRRSGASIAWSRSMRTRGAAHGAVAANVSFNILGSVAENPIDEIFYENRGRARLVRTTTGDQLQNDIERLRVYQASVTWDTPDFKLEASTARATTTGATRATSSASTVKPTTAATSTSTTATRRSAWSSRASGSWRA
jgi:hypothetical protein